MLGLVPRWATADRAPTVVCLGAHCDDIEIGAGGLLLTLAAEHPGLRVLAVVLSGTPEREAETRAALPAFLPGARLDLAVHDLPDGRLPAQWDRVKDIVEQTSRAADQLGGADIVLAPWSGDAHQDHRMLGELVPTAFRNVLTLHYEILKSDGDIGRPNLYAPLLDSTARHKCELLHKHYGSQHRRPWFDEEAFLGFMRVRGVECRGRYAEAFFCSTVVLDLAPRTIRTVS